LKPKPILGPGFLSSALFNALTPSVICHLPAPLTDTFALLAWLRSGRQPASPARSLAPLGAPPFRADLRAQPRRRGPSQPARPPTGDDPIPRPGRRPQPPSNPVAPAAVSASAVRPPHRARYDPPAQPVTAYPVGRVALTRDALALAPVAPFGHFDTAPAEQPGQAQKPVHQQLGPAPGHHWSRRGWQAGRAGIPGTDSGRQPRAWAGRALRRGTRRSWFGSPGWAKWVIQRVETASHHLDVFRWQLLSQRRAIVQQQLVIRRSVGEFGPRAVRQRGAASPGSQGEVIHQLTRTTNYPQRRSHSVCERRGGGGWLL